MNTTLGDTYASGDRAAPSSCRWYVTVAHHPDPSARGERCVLAPGSTVDVGRDGEPFRRAVRGDARISRRHCRFAVDAQGNLVVVDLESRNGTFVNGARIGSESLSSRDVVRFGSSVCVVRRFDHTLEPTRIAYSTASPVVQRALLDLEQIGRQDRCVVFHGAPHCDLERLVAAFEGIEPIVVAPASSSRDVTKLLSSASAPLFFSSWPPSDDAETKSIVAVLARTSRRSYFVVEPRELGATDALGETFRRELHPIVFVAPRIRDRSEDVLVYLEGFAKMHHGTDIRVDPVLATALLRGDWPANLLGLEQFARVYLRPTGDATIAWRDEFAAVLGVPETKRPERGHGDVNAERRASESPRFRIAADGKWFEGPDRTRVDLTMRFALSRVLRALVEQHRRDREKFCSVDDLVRAGWPGERPVADTGANRVYVAITTLRKLGLRALIERGEDGYRFAQRERCEIAETSR